MLALSTEIVSCYKLMEKKGMCAIKKQIINYVLHIALCFYKSFYINDRGKLKYKL